MIDPVNPSTTNLCGTFTDPDDADEGRGYSAPIWTSCAKPTGLTVDAAVPIVFVNDEPVADV